MLQVLCENAVMIVAQIMCVTIFLFAVNSSMMHGVHEKIPVKAVLYALASAGILGPVLAAGTGLSIPRFTLGYFAALMIFGICSMRWFSATREISRASEFDTPADVSGRAELIRERQLLSQPVARRATLVLTIAATALLLGCILL